MIFKTDLITNNRPRTSLRPQYVTLHNTGNSNSTAQANRNWFDNPRAQVSAHWVVDEKEAILCVPEHEVAWHALTEGNRLSIGVEVCEFADSTRHNNAYKNAVTLCAAILKRHSLTADKLTTHKRWTGKECPRHILPVWIKFVSDVGRELNKPTVIFNNKQIDVPVRIVNGRAYVQLEGENGPAWVQIRALSNLLGAELTWDERTQTAKMTIL